MCGVAGIIQADPSRFGKEHIKKMTDALAHRGPDGEGIWQNDEGTALLGHRRLAIIDLSEAARQPMHLTPALSINGEGGNRYTIIHNGEIYNYTELKEELLKKGYSFRTSSDTEVIAVAYDCWKEDCVDHFDGMFAFAIWDEKEKELFAARDRLGEKPFYYYFKDDILLFASEMKALWAGGIERKPNLKMLFNFITIGYVDNPNNPDETFFENINKLPAACFLKYKLRQKLLEIEKYWDIDLGNLQQKISDEEAIEQFNHLFSISVKRRLRSDVSVGTSLSGGLDSSSVLATIMNLRKASPSRGGLAGAFTATFPGFEKDESSYSKLVAEKFNLQQNMIPVSADDLMNDWEKFSLQQETPVGSASAFAQYKVFELAKKYNVKVLLDGQGADEILAGYHKYYKWYWQELFRKRKLVKSKELKAARELGIKEEFGYKNILASLFPDFAGVFLERQYLLHALQQDDLTKDFIRTQSKEAYYMRPAHLNLNGVLYFNTCVHGLEELLRYADRNSMAHGREVRLPFLSHKLVELIFSLPSNFKIRQGWTKWLLRKAMNERLPGEITWRRDKVGFEPPQKSWMENHRVKEAIQEAKRKLVKEKILKPGTLDNKIESKAAHDADNFDWRYFSSAIIL